MLFIKSEIRYGFEQRAQELVGGHEIVKGEKRNGIHDPRIMRVKCNNIGYTVISELFQRKCTVQRLSAGTSVLPAFVEEREYNIDPVRLAVRCGNDTFEILKIIVRRHVIDTAADFVGDGIICHIAENEQIGATD